MFRISSKGTLSDADMHHLQVELLEDPRSGVLIRGTGGARKLRLGIASRGKRGGVRLIYYHHVAAARVYLLLVYPKSAADGLSQAGRRAMRKLITAINQEAW